jgi:Dictyostelium (slime mold) repeat
MKMRRVNMATGASALPGSIGRTLTFLLLMAGLAGPAHAANVCNGMIQIEYVTGPSFPKPGDVVRVRLTVGTGNITGVVNPTFTLNRIRFDLDCQNPPPPGAVPCTDDGSVIKYRGDATITSTCPGATFTTGHAASDTPNEVVFTPNVAIMMPANTPTFCQIEFDVEVMGPSTDGTPTVAEEVTGYNAAAGDGMCNNGLSSSGAQSGSIPLCPPCNDNNACTTETCNNETGQCDTTSTVTCNDNNACTTESCNTATGQCQTTSTVICNDSNACTTESCNTATGQCQTTSTVTCNGCQQCNTTTGTCQNSVTCNDNNACTTESCNTTTGQCQTTSTVSCTDNNPCTTESCNTTTGQCQTTSTVSCTDNNPCTIESCNSATGQCQTTSTVTCNDNNVCTTESCNSATGQCQTTSTVTCPDDGNPCTVERCNPQTGMCESFAGGASFLVRTKGRFGSRSRISGLFGANDEMGMIQLGRDSFITDGNDLVGDFVSLGTGVSVFRVLTNHDVHLGLGAIIRAGTEPVDLPFTNPFCPIPAISCTGGTAEIVPPSGTLTLTPGGSPYGTVLVRNSATLTFAGPGTFTLCSLFTARGAQIIVTGAGQTTINIAGDFRLANNGTLLPAPGTPRPIINIAGTTVRVGARSRIQATLSAPNAEFSSGREAQLEGIFCANSSRSDKGVILICPNPTP